MFAVTRRYLARLPCVMLPFPMTCARVLPEALGFGDEGVFLHTPRALVCAVACVVPRFGVGVPVPLARTFFAPCQWVVGLIDMYLGTCCPVVPCPGPPAELVVVCVPLFVMD